MITENYVSFEIAKLLKEKGFNEPCLMCYTSDGNWEIMDIIGVIRIVMFFH